VVRHPPLFYFADPLRPVWRETRRYADGSQGPEVVYVDETAPDYGLITSQTCDICEEEVTRPLKPWVQLAPVFPLSGNSGHKKSLRRGRGPAHYVYLPNLPGEEFWVADLRIEVPVEKGWLAFQEKLVGFPSEEAQRAVSSKLAHLRGRPAFSAAFVAAIQRPLHEAFDDLFDRNRTLYLQLDADIEEVGLRADNFLAMTRVQLVFLGTGPFSQATLGWCRDWHDAHFLTAQGLGINMLPPELVRFADISAAEYRSITVVLRGELASSR